MVDELDYEQKKQYELTVRATDSVSGVYAEVLVSILVLDVNDCPPEFTQDSYNISVSEAAVFGTPVLRVSSRDNDTGKRKVPISELCTENQIDRIFPGPIHMDEIWEKLISSSYTYLFFAQASINKFVMLFKTTPRTARISSTSIPTRA